MVQAKGWSRRVGSARSFVGNALGGVRGWTNVASWAVAGTLAYYLWARPARQLQKEQQVDFPLLIPIAAAVVFYWMDRSGHVAFSDEIAVACSCPHLYMPVQLIPGNCRNDACIGAGIKSLLFTSRNCALACSELMLLSCFWKGLANCQLHFICQT